MVIFFRKIFFVMGLVVLFIINWTKISFPKEIPSLKLGPSSAQESSLVKGEIFEGEKRTHQFFVDSCMEKASLLFILSPGKDLTLKLTTPDGFSVEPLIGKQYSEVKYQETSIGKVYIIENPKSGVWTAEVSAEKGLGKEKYELKVILKSKITLRYISRYYYDYFPGLPLQLTVSFLNGKLPITKAKIKAIIRKPDSSVARIKLSKDPLEKPGIYSAIFKDTNLRGKYEVTFEAFGEVEGKKIKKRTSVDLWVGIYPDLVVFPSDIKFSKENPNTEEEINIYATIHNLGEVPAKDVEVFFYECIPKKTEEKEEELVNIGEVNILKDILPGEKSDISIKYKANKYAGKYRICVQISPFLQFMEKNYDNNRACREITISGVHPSSFTGAFLDYGEDTDGDGLFNWLTVEIEINVTRDGYYDVSGWLYSGGEKDIEDLIATLEHKKAGWKAYEREHYTGFTNRYSYLKRGLNKVKLMFDSIRISRKLKSKKESSFILAGLALEDEEGNIIDFKRIAYVTKSYNYKEFERGGKIIGRVTDEMGNPLPRAFVEAIGKNGYGGAYTKADGTYIIGDLYDGEYKVKVDPRDYTLKKESISVKVLPDKEVEANFKLKRKF